MGFSSALVVVVIFGSVGLCESSPSKPLILPDFSKLKMNEKTDIKSEVFCERSDGVQLKDGDPGFDSCLSDKASKVGAGAKTQF